MVREGANLRGGGREGERLGRRPSGGGPRSAEAPPAGGKLKGPVGLRRWVGRARGRGGPCCPMGFFFNVFIKVDKFRMRLWAGLRLREFQCIFLLNSDRASQRLFGARRLGVSRRVSVSEGLRPCQRGVGGEGGEEGLIWLSREGVSQSETDRERKT